MTRSLALAAALALLAAAPVAAAPGDLDTDFGNGGRLIFDFGGSDFAFDVLTQADGKTVTIGIGGAAPRGFRITRVNPDGSPDRSFGENGTAAPDFTNLDEGAVGARLVAGGKIVIVGTARNDLQSSIIVARLLANGQPDSTFDGDGVAIVAADRPAAGSEVAVAPDGGVVVAGSPAAVAGMTANTGTIVARLTAAGAPDPGFNNGAPLYVDPDSAGLTLFQRAMALQPDGGILLAFSVSSLTDPNLGLARLTPSGTLDTGFARGGTYLSYDLGGEEMPMRMVLQPDGKIVVAGFGGPGDRSALVRFTADGSLDATFGRNGLAGNLGGLTLEGVAVQANGKLVAVGGSEAGDGIAMRVQPGGTLDTTFSGNGVMPDVFGGGDDSANAVALQRDGAVLAAGGSAFNHVLARLQGDGSSGGPAPLPGGGGGPGGGGPGGGGPGGGVPRCAGKRATIVGTPRSERLKGTRRSDVIVALGGNDKIAGGRGNDLICAGDGNDSIDGGDGSDRLYGQNGKDKLGGAGGNDSLSGGAGNDKLGGGAGKDNLTGGAGKDRMSGGSGRDKCAGNAGRDGANCERGRA
jgi:uncharacterized delta-60 repeat protein